METCAITGHRFSRFKFKLQDTNTACKRLKKRLHDQFVLLYEQGVRTYIIGGDLGVDNLVGGDPAGDEETAGVQRTGADHRSAVPRA